MPAAPKTIDCTPTWTQALPLLFTLMESGTTKTARDIAKEEICRMAGIADAHIAQRTQLPEPPQIIKLDENNYHGLDLRNPVHAKAYLLAASHFLSGWPQDWDAETLCLALLAEDDEDEHYTNQLKIRNWEAIGNSENFKDEGWLFVEQIINDLAENFVNFAESISG